uniref:Uncharacterized protein n=1 Tax=viral metagenome TaxID=1070528 RepID=A0A6C0CIP1_9ZZZZ
MEEEKIEITSHEKWILAVLLAVLFLLLSTPLAFQTGNRFLSFVGFSYIKNNQITPAGWILHAVIFALLVRLMMK